MNNEIVEKLLKLAAKHPELPIRAFIASDIIGGDEYAYWLGEITSADIEEIYTGYEGRVWTKDEAEAEYEELFEECAPEDVQEKADTMEDEERDTEIKKWIACLPWKKVILCYVEGAFN